MSTIHPDTTVNSHPDLQTSSFKEESSSLGLLRSLLAWLTLLSLGFFAGWWLGQSQATRHSQIALTDTALKSTNVSEGMVVTAEPIVQRTVARTVNAVGSLHAFEEVVVSSKVEGRVLRIAADVSTRVQPDAVLLELDSTDASLAVRQAERSLQAELAKWGFQKVPDENEDLSQLPSVRSAKAKFELAKGRFERMQQLKKSESISDDDYEQAKTDVGVLENEWRKEQLQAQSSAAVARLRAAELAIAQQRLSDCIVRAPIPTTSDPDNQPEYVVSERLVSEGSLLRPGTEVFRLVFGRTLKLRLSVPEVYATSVQPGQKVDVFTTSGTESIPGSVAKVAPSVDRATRTFMVEVYVSNIQGNLKPGGFAKANIRIAEAEQAITVPAASVYSLAGVHKIFVIEEGLAKEYQVVLGEQSTEWVEITKPRIPVGAMVITSGQRMLSDGDFVQIRKPESENSSSEDPS